MAGSSSASPCHTSPVLRDIYAIEKPLLTLLLFILTIVTFGCASRHIDSHSPFGLPPSTPYSRPNTPSRNAQAGGALTALTHQIASSESPAMLKFAILNAPYGAPRLPASAGSCGTIAAELPQCRPLSARADPRSEETATTSNHVHSARPRAATHRF